MQPPAPQNLEKYSSAVTLSDMEIFVFPELLYSLVLANIMSPRIWAWRADPWFKGLEKMNPYRRIQRLKQYIIDHYEFNLDLDTWGLTTKEREVARFAPFMDVDTLARSNALFGYEGDKFYFSIDIRRHFGLDKYQDDVIPYWKTETVEAMDAFRFRDGYRTGAGECVSLSTLYAAALYVVCGVSLDDIFLMATPLHSQNFVLAGEGVLTNNRRLVTRTMWFNGTELTAKAQRALRNEQVTVVAHRTGYIHCVYPEATIRPEAYRRFAERLRAFLTTDITFEVLASFLRQTRECQTCFQLRHLRHGRAYYIGAEKVYPYEHAGPYKVSDDTRQNLLAEIDLDEFFTEPIVGRTILDDLEAYFKDRPIPLNDPAALQAFLDNLACQHMGSREAIEKLVAFARLDPRLPAGDGDRRFVPSPELDLPPGLSREEIIARVEAARGDNPVADLAFYAARDLARTDWTPFLKAALERNPVSRQAAQDMDEAALVRLLEGWPAESIYDGSRCAQPDEVWNYRRGDGFEKAVCLANLLKARHPEAVLRLTADAGRAGLEGAGVNVAWPSVKGLSGRADL